MSATLTTFNALLKEVYAPGIHNQTKEDNVLLRELTETSEGVRSEDEGGRYAVVFMRMGRNTSTVALGEGGTWNAPGQTRPARAEVQLTEHVTSGGFTKKLDLQTKKGQQSAVRAIEEEMRGVTEGHSHRLGQEVWNAEHGAFATIAAGGVSGSGPWVLTLADRRAIMSDWLEEGQEIQLATVSGVTATVLDSGAILSVTSVDEANNAITVAQVSGTSSPTAGERIIVAGSANHALVGLDQIISDTTTTFQAINRTTERRWRSVRKNQAGAFSYDGYKALVNEIHSKSGRTLPKDRVALTTFGIARAAFNELQDQVRYSDPNNLHAGDGVILPDGTKLVADEQAKPGSIYVINKKDLFILGDRKGEFLNDDGSMFRRFGRTLSLEFAYYQAMQLAAYRLNGSGEIYGITDAGGY